MLLDTPDPTTRHGIRDRAMLDLGTAGGLRVSELVGVRVSEVKSLWPLPGAAHSRQGQTTARLGVVEGRGRRSARVARCSRRRAGPRALLERAGPADDTLRLQHVLEKHLGNAVRKCPSLATKRVSPHVLRHTCAMNLLRATGDIRKVALWLGHVSQKTTEIYLQADPTEKLEVLGDGEAALASQGPVQPARSAPGVAHGSAPATSALAPRRRSSATSRSPDSTK